MSEVSGNPIEGDPMLCVLCPPGTDPHPFADHLARKEAARDRTVDVLMTHTIKAMPRFPPSSDMVEFTVHGDKVGLYCLICGVDLSDDVNYLNQALVIWQRHREDHP